MLDVFEKIADLYTLRCLKPTWEACPNYLDDPWDSLRLFLKGYAFERMGRPGDFAQAAVDAVDEARAGGLNAGVVVRVWESFRGKLENDGLNYANNPLCPRGAAYTRMYRGEERPATVQGLSIIELVVQGLGGRPLVAWAKMRIEEDELVEAHRQLQQVNGIKDKITSFFLRDIATQFNLAPANDRAFLQPIDGWVRYVAHRLSGQELPDVDCANYIVANSDAPERANQGIWYFGARVALSKYQVRRSLDERSYLRRLVAQHIDEMQRHAEIAEQFRCDWSDDQ